VNKAHIDGCEVILGGFNTCLYAKQIGLKNAIIQTGREIFWQSITEAKRAAHISRREQEKTERFKTVLDFSLEGIISYDSIKHITIVNKMTEKILKPAQPILPGQTIHSSPIPQDFKQHLMSDKEYINEIIKIDDSMITFNKANIVVKESVIGSVVTFQEVKGIQDLESRIRKQIYSRGHVAKSRFYDIVGDSDVLRESIATAKRYSITHSNILLVGDSGTGKEIFSQSIHNYSLRKSGPFVAVNCAALPENLLESELFGYADGAFTGAVKGGKPGFFELAHNGTIFLDEIGEIPIKLQAKLLRIIQEKEVIRLGDSKVIPVNIRLISATNKNLEDLVETGIFREDLFFRLNVLCMTLPSLHERREDIPLLAEYFFQINYPHIKLADSAKSILMAYEWPGNIRQLFNICERLAVLSDSSLITEKDVRHVFNLQENRHKSDFSTIRSMKSKDTEKERILKILYATKYNRKDAARLLCMDRSTLWRKMKEYKL
ncbi:MAG: sigma 54-interacting transcriptional regulator, partial [Clostridia bacterium]